MLEIIGFIIVLIVALRVKQQRALKTSQRVSPAKKHPPSVFVTNREMTCWDEMDAQFGRGRFIGKTGNPFVDDSFFNPWAPGGDFNR